MFAIAKQFNICRMSLYCSLQGWEVLEYNTHKYLAILTSTTAKSSVIQSETLHFPHPESIAAVKWYGVVICWSMNSNHHKTLRNYL